VFDYYDSEYMATIGSKGGLSVSKDKKHMAVIGRKGGVAKAKKVKNGKK
jgi:general stress protein YciG